MIMCVCLFGHSAVVFHEFNVLLCFTDSLCGCFFSDILLIYSAASLFNKITYVVREVWGSTASFQQCSEKNVSRLQKSEMTKYTLGRHDLHSWWGRVPRVAYGRLRLGPRWLHHCTNLRRQLYVPTSVAEWLARLTAV